MVGLSLGKKNWDRGEFKFGDENTLFLEFY